MAKDLFGSEATVIPVVRQDGTVYFRHAASPISERLCGWMLAFLWFLVPLVVLATMSWLFI